TGTGWTTANFGDLFLNADVDITFETEFGNNRPLSYYHDLGANFGIAFFNAWIPQVEGDYDNNGMVDTADYTVWREQLGATLTLPNEDPTVTPGQVTIEDYTVWKNNFGMTAAAGSATSFAVVPEPTCIALLISGTGLLSMCRSRRTRDNEVS
ncbi:MAG: PEP-CTERM sorting domain-containing protein, partial [Aeoliella sp.]